MANRNPLNLRRFLLGLVVLCLLLGWAVKLPASALAQSEGEQPPLTFDGSANPPQAKAGENVSVQFILVGNPDLCDPVETRRPLDIALVVDRSGSMEDPLGAEFSGSKLQGAIQAIDNFLGVIDPNQDRVGLVSFAGNGAELSGLGSATQVRAELPNLEMGTGLLGSGTNIESGIRTAHALLKQSGRPRSTASSILILLTDGQQTGGDAASAAHDAKVDDIRIITIGLGPDVDENLLRQVASQTSDYYYAPQTSDLQSIYESIVKSIQTFDPATEIEVAYHFDASNFDLVEGSIDPAADVLVNTITWRFDTLQNNQQKMSLALRARVPGTYYAAPGIEIRYLACGQERKEERIVNRYPIEVIPGGGATAPVCAGLPVPEPGWLARACTFPWWLIGALLVGLPLLLQWLRKYWDQIRAWFRCRIPPDRCTLFDLPWRIWLAVLAGLLLNTVAGFACAPREGIVFWRVLPDRTSALFVKSLVPDTLPRPLTPLVGEEQCVGCHTTSQSNQTIVAIARGTNGLLMRLNLEGGSITVPSLQGSYPKWSPDGRYLAYAANNEDIYILDVESGVAQPLLGASEPGVVETMPAWSADGQRIAFVRASGSDQNITITTPSDILSVPAQGGVPTLIPGASGFGFNYHPAYSPDGKWLAFTHHTDGTTTYGEPRAEIYLVPAEGGAPRRLQANDGPGGQKIEEAGNTYPTWSQDGQHLFFSSRRCDQQYDIYITKVDENGNSGSAERLATISDPLAFEYGAHEILFRQPTLLARIVNLWPWFLPLLILLLLLWLACRQGAASRESHTVQTNIEVKPAEGWLRPRQRFEVNLELFGISGCARRTVQRNVDVVLLLDSSGSMGEMDMGSRTRLSAAKQAASQFVRCVIGSTERVAVVNFDSDTRVQQGLTNREGDLLRAIQAIDIGGSTAMHLGLQKVAEILNRDARANSIQVIILLSDGVPDDPGTALRAAEEIRLTGTRIMTLGIGEADADLLRAVAGDTGTYRYASDRKGLAEAFLEVGRELILPPAATQVTFTHHYDSEKFELIPGSVMPQPQNQAPGVLSWQIGELDARPHYFRYLVRPLQAGEHYIDRLSDVTYKRCGLGRLVQMPVEPAALVNVREYTVVKPLPKAPEPVQRLRYVEPEAVWQPDRAVFIGIGGAGRWVLTHLRKNLLDAGGGKLPNGSEFLVIDTDERETVSGRQVPVQFANVEISYEDVLVLDENLRRQVSEWAQQDEPLAEHSGWFDALAYKGLDQELNLATGTYGRRPLPRVALLRNLQGVREPASKWYEKRIKLGKATDLRQWLLERCEKAYRKDRDQVRIFVVSSLAGGMGGILVDVANLARQTANQVVTRAGNVRIEGYLIDGVPYETLPGGQEAGDQRMANTFAAWREIARWQMNPGILFNPGWGSNERLDESPFDDVVFFSGRVGEPSRLPEDQYPAMADVITARLDRATGAGEDADWFNLMQRARSDRHNAEHTLIVGAASIYTMRLPVADILQALHARWANELLHLYLAGASDREVRFDSSLTEDPGFTSDPAAYVPIFLNSIGEFGGEAPLESQVLADYLLMETSDLVGTEELSRALVQTDEQIRTNVEGRLSEAVRHILYGSTLATSTGSRAARLQYVLQFLEGLANQTGTLYAQLSTDWNRPELARVARIYRLAAEDRKANLERLRNLISNSQSDQSHGLVEELGRVAARHEGVRDELDRLKRRKYFWGMVEQDSPGDRVEKPLFDIWWSKYLAGTVEAYLGYLGWVDVDGKQLDLEIRLEEDPICLTQDGIEAMVSGLIQMAGNLTRNVWQEATLWNVLDSHRTLESRDEGQAVRRQTNPTEFLSAVGDPGVPIGRLLYIAPGAVQTASAHKPFIDGLHQIQPGEMVALEFSALEGTDRTSVAVLRLQDALRVDRLDGYRRAEVAYDRVDSWNASAKKFMVPFSGNLRATMKPEGEARKLEQEYDFPHLENVSHKLHSLVVASLQAPARAELYCLALADGLVWKDPTNQIVLQVDETIEPLVLLKQSRPQVDPYVDALLLWALHPEPAVLKPWEEHLANRFSNPASLDRTRLDPWISGPQSPFATGLPDHVSLGKMVTALVRCFMRTGKRRWKDD